MSSDRNLPLWVRDRKEVLRNDAGVEWRGGKRPNYSITNAHLEKEKKYCYGAGSIEAMPRASFAIAYNLVRSGQHFSSIKHRIATGILSLLTIAFVWQGMFLANDIAMADSMMLAQTGGRMVTWNMQGGNDELDNKWNAYVRRLVRQHTYVALQEAGALPASNVSDEDPPPGGDSIPPNYAWRFVKWNINTRSRPENVYVFWLREESSGRIALAICSKAKADRLLFIPPPMTITNARPSIGIELGPDRVYTLHALSPGGGDARGLVEQIARGPQPWYALGDYNREPNWTPPEGSIIDPPDGPTQQSGGRLDYRVSFAPGGVEPEEGRVGPLWSDHAPVSYD